MLSWVEFFSIIFYGTLCGVGEIALLEIALLFPAFENFVKKNCENWVIEVSKGNVFYNISANGKISLSPFHPNIISLNRTIGCVVIVPIVSLVNPQLAIYLYIIFSVADYADGRVARKCDLGTEIGKRFDPLCDKICYLSQILFRCLSIFFLFQGLSKWAFFLLLSELWGQFVVRPILPSLGLEKNVAANKIGKLKALLCFAFVPYSFLVSEGAPIVNWEKGWLMICFVLSMLSWVFKLIPKRWYANFFTAFNLICGLVAFRFAGYNNAYVMLLILAGQCFDALDGKIAEKYGGTPPWGELFDDIADLVSFGVVPAKMIILALRKTTISYVFGGIYFFAIFFRLVRFLLVDNEIIQANKKLNFLEEFSLSSKKFMKEKIGHSSFFSFLFFDKKERERGDNIFAGLPSPAAATIGLGATLLFPWWLLYPTIILIVKLTVGRMHFAHFVHKILPKMSIWLKAMLALIVLGVVARTLISGQYLEIALLSLIYGGAYFFYNLCKYNYAS